MADAAEDVAHRGRRGRPHRPVRRRVPARGRRRCGGPSSRGARRGGRLGLPGSPTRPCRCPGSSRPCGGARCCARRRRCGRPGGMLTGPDAQNPLLDEAHVVAATWSAYGTAPCDPTAPFAGVFPFPCHRRGRPLRPGRQRPRRRPAGARPGVAAVRPATRHHGVGAGRGRLGHHAARPPGTAPATGSPPRDRRRGLTPSRPPAPRPWAPPSTPRRAPPPPYGGLAAMALFAPVAVDFDPAAWDAIFAATPLEPLVRAGGRLRPRHRPGGGLRLAGRRARRPRRRGLASTDSGAAPASLPGSPPGVTPPPPTPAWPAPPPTPPGCRPGGRPGRGPDRPGAPPPQPPPRRPRHHPARHHRRGHPDQPAPTSPTG